MSGVAAVALALGGGAGRAMRNWAKAREDRQHKEEADREEQMRLAEDDRRIRRAIVGGPATDWEPEWPGLFKVTAELQEGQRKLVEAQSELSREVGKLHDESTRLAREFHEHITAAHRERGR